MSKITFTETRTVQIKNDVDLSEPHWWEVTTEGDEEGRTTTRLGIHHGTLVDIARILAPSVYYELHFRWINPTEYPTQQSPKAPARVQLSVQGIHPKDLMKALRQTGATVVGNGARVSLTL